MYAYILWIPLEDKLFKLIGLAPLEYKTQLEESAKSLRVLKKNEKNSFTINLVRVVQARQGETIETLSARTGNRLNEELTGVINSINSDDKLGEGGQIKVVIQSPYKIDK